MKRKRQLPGPAPYLETVGFVSCGDGHGRPPRLLRARLAFVDEEPRPPRLLLARPAFVDEEPCLGAEFDGTVGFVCCGEGDGQPPRLLRARLTFADEEPPKPPELAWQRAGTSGGQTHPPPVRTGVGPGGG